MLKIALILSIIACIVSGMNFYKLWQLENNFWTIPKSIIIEHNSSDKKNINDSEISSDEISNLSGSMEPISSDIKNKEWSLVISDCESILIETEKTFCTNQNIFKTAALKEDIGLCKTIADDEIRWDCEWYVNMLISQK